MTILPSVAVSLCVLVGGSVEQGAAGSAQGAAGSANASGEQGHSSPPKAVVRPRIGTLVDKTLVAWVAPARLDQQGGAALSLIDPQERFDAIVLGEVAAGRWMAGSDFFRRTPNQQTSWPAETADPKTTVQIAIVYRGCDVTLYRNGVRYAAYRIAAPQSFSDDATVLLGLRYLGGMGPIGFLHGAIDEARIYDTALDGPAIAALAPGKPSTPAPLGAWTFDDGTTRDSAGRFPPGVLCGAARIAGGKLLLDGKDAYMVVEPPAPEVQTMFYRPYRRDTGRMWDTWLALDGDAYYLFTLANAGRAWDNISMAVSSDGVHWRERGPVLHKAADAVWMGTGHTWRSPQSGGAAKFQLNFSEWRGDDKTGQQTIFFAESPDLLHWKRSDRRFEFLPNPRWYETGRANASRWDCIYAIPRPGGGLFGYWTANPKGRIGFGFGESLDGVAWRALPPPAIDWTNGCEAGAVEKIGDRYHLMLGSGAEGHHGMFAFVADRPEGPFVRAKKNFRLLTSQGHGNTYFARFFRTPGGVLVNHHSIARNGMVHFGLLKRASPDRDGALRLRWWEGNERLKHQPVPVVMRAVAGSGSAQGATGSTHDATGFASVSAEHGQSPRHPTVGLLSQPLDAREGFVLEGTLPSPAAEAAPTGLYVEHASADNRKPADGTAILLGATGVVEIGTLDPRDGKFQVQNRIERDMAFAPTPHFRLVLKDSLLEFYLNDVLIQCYSLPAAAGGRIGAIQPPGASAAGDWKAWR